MNNITTSFLGNATIQDKAVWGSKEDNATSAAADVLHTVSGLLWAMVPPMLLAIGSFGNAMTVAVMRGMLASPSSACIAVYFTGLAISDLFLLVSCVFWYWLRYYLPQLYEHDLTCTVPFFVSYASCLASAWILVTMTCQRVLSVVVPHRVAILCTKRRGKVVVGVIVVVACAVNVNIFFNYHRIDIGGDFAPCQSIDYDLATFFLSVDLALSSLIPFCLLLIGNSVLILRLIKSRQSHLKMTNQNEAQTQSQYAQVSNLTVTLILTSMAFCLLTLPSCIVDRYLEDVGFYEGAIEHDVEYAQLSLVENASVLLWMTNSAINFYIYILSGSKFREETKRLLRLVCSRTVRQ